MASTKRPRIGVDFHTFDGLFQGSRSHLLGIYGEAVTLAPEVDFYFLTGNPKLLAAANPAFGASNVRCVPLPTWGGVARLGWQLGVAGRRYGIDLLHVQYRLPFFASGPCVCTIHDTLFETHPWFFTPRFVRMARWTSRWAVRRAAVLFTVSRYSRDEIVRLYGIEPERIVITANGVDRARFWPAGGDHDEVPFAERRVLAAYGLRPGSYLCTVGRIEPRKNHVGLLKAYARLRTPRPPLAVIGQRDFRFDSVFENARRLGLGENLFFLDAVGDAELPILLRHAMAFVYPTFAEGFGMPVVEAMASGVPVLTSDVTALPEVTAGSALLADPADSVELGQELQRLVDDEALRKKLARAGVAQAAKFDWHRPAKALVSALRSQLRQGRRVA